MKKTITDISKKYNYSSIIEKIESINKTPTIKIGFIGEYSAGKTSLINSIVNTHLPVDILPTTKAICRITPVEGLEKNSYYKENFEGENEQISFKEFSDIIRTEQKEIVLSVNTPPCDVLPMGVSFVDTPGIHTVEGEEQNLTFNYLSFLDAAIVCINITEGTINKKLVDFICNPKIKHLQDYMLFALTWADRKTDAEASVVIENIVNLLKKYVDDGILSLNNIENKVFTVSSNENNANRVYGLLKENILADLPIIYERKINEELKLIGKDLLELLEEQLRISTFDSSQIEKEIEKVEKEENDLKNKLKDQKEKVSQLEEKLNERIKSALEGHLYSLKTAKTAEDVHSVVEAINTDLHDTIDSIIKRYLGIVDDTSKHLTFDLESNINILIKRIENISQVMKTIASAALTTMLPGTGALDVAQAIGGAAISEAGKNATKELTKCQKFFLALNNLNPVNSVFDLVSNEVSYHLCKAEFNKLRNLIVDLIMTEIDVIYNEQIVTPLNDKIYEKKKMLEGLGDKQNEAYKRFIELKGDLKDDINSIKAKIC